jgi:hypothetical protein
MDNLTRILSDPSHNTILTRPLLILSAIPELLSAKKVLAVAARPSSWVFGLVGWATFCAMLRRRREKAMLARYGYTGRESLARMTTVQAQAIYKEMAEYEFPMMSTLSMQFALFKVGCPL